MLAIFKRDIRLTLKSYYTGIGEGVEKVLNKDKNSFTPKVV